jgi:hypothetical protein
VASIWTTDIITDLSIDWIDSLDDDEPFCLLVHHKAPPPQAMNYRHQAPPPVRAGFRVPTRTSPAAYATWRMALLCRAVSRVA